MLGPGLVLGLDGNNDQPTCRVDVSASTGFLEFDCILICAFFSGQHEWQGIYIKRSDLVYVPLTGEEEDDLAIHKLWKSQSVHLLICVPPKSNWKSMFRLGWHVVQVLGAELCSVTGVSLVSICRHMPIMIPLPPPTQDYHCSNHQHRVTCSSKPPTSPRQGKDQDAATPPDPKVLASKLENVKDRTSTAS